MGISNNQTIAQKIGNEGERMAAEWLWLKGFEIVEQNWRTGRKEVDLVCKQGKDWVFVEVKTRTGMQMIRPEKAVNYKKRKLLTVAAQEYMQQKSSNSRYRFDVIAVSILPWGKNMMYFKGE